MTLSESVPAADYDCGNKFYLQYVKIRRSEVYSISNRVYYKKIQMRAHCSALTSQSSGSLAAQAVVLQTERSSDLTVERKLNSTGSSLTHRAEL
jgi:hypothetical protein